MESNQKHQMENSNRGRAHSSPIVWGNRVFLTTAVEGEVVPGAKAVKHIEGDKEFLHPDSIGADRKHTFKVICLDRETRKGLLASECMGRHALRQSSPQEFLRCFDARDRRQAGLCVLRHRRSLCLRHERQACLESGTRKNCERSAWEPELLRFCSTIWSYCSVMKTMAQRLS